MDAGVGALLGAVVVLALVVAVMAAALRSQRRRLDELAVRLQPTLPEVPPRVAPVVPSQPTPQEAEFVITRVGQARDDDSERVGNQLVLSATMGEPLVKAAAFAHGVRRALAAESRNRIMFHVRQEVRRTRKERRREMRAAWRESKQRDVV